MLRRLINAVRRLAGTAAPGRVERDLDEELRFHLDMETAELRRLGAGADEARRTATRRFGQLGQVKRELRDRRRALWLEDLVSDVRFAARTLAASPGYALVVIVTLGLGIGANAAIFSVIDGVLVEPLANTHGDRLVELRQQVGLSRVTPFGFSPLDLAEYRDQLHTVDGIVEFHAMTFNLIGQGDPEEVRTGVVDHRFFDVMGVTPILGRGFTAAEDAGAADAVIVLSHRYWQSRFGGDPGIVGRIFTMNGRVHTVIGVLPPFTLPIACDIFVPTSQCPVRSSAAVKSNRTARMVTAFARLRPAATVADLQTELAGVAARLGPVNPAAYPVGRGYTAVAHPLKDELVASARPTLVLLLAAVGFVLLVACANVANLTLARLSRRESELAIRAALGAGRGRLLRQLLTESTVLALMGGVVGIGLAWAGGDLLRTFAARFTPRAGDVHVDASVVAFTACLSILTGLAFGAAPALSWRRTTAGVLRESSGASATVRKRRLQAGLVVVQLALAFLLLSGAGLLMRSLFLLVDVDTGVVSQNVLTMRVVLPIETYQRPAAQRQRWLPILARVRDLPGVLSDAAAMLAPLKGGNSFGVQYEVEGEASDPNARPRAQQRNVTTDYFRTVGIPVLRGRSFSAGDDDGRPMVSVINRTFARALFGDGDPLGRRLVPCNASGVCSGAQAMEIVGVVGDTQDAGLEVEPPGEVYLSALQSGAFGENLLVRATGDPTPLSRRIIALVHDVDPTLPVEDVQTLDAIRSDALAPRRLTTTLLSLFAAVALLVTLAGVVGVTAFSVSQRRRENRRADGPRRHAIPDAATRGGGVALVRRRRPRRRLRGDAGVRAAHARPGVGHRAERPNHARRRDRDLPGRGGPRERPPRAPGRPRRPGDRPALVSEEGRPARLP